VRRSLVDQRRFDKRSKRANSSVESATKVIRVAHDINGIKAHLRRSAAALERAASNEEFVKVVQTAIDVVTKAYQHRRKLLIAGNGGSAADAQHIAAEFVARYRFDRTPLSAIALSTDTSVLTAIGNDYGYEHVFERQLRGLGQTGDVFIGISTSGRSPNILAALKTARQLGITAVGFTGSGEHAAPMRALTDHLLVAPTDDTPIVQQVHIAAAHAICEAVEHNLFKDDAETTLGSNICGNTLR
jgi:D-sedoheptulose 7-phosphate isomerase